MHGATPYGAGCRVDCMMTASAAAAGAIEVGMKPGRLPMVRIAGGALFALLLVAPLAAAQGAQDQEAPANLPSELAQLSLEELADVKIDSVYGASLFLQKVTEAPSSVTIITADHIQKYGYRTLGRRVAQCSRLLRHQRPQLQLPWGARLFSSRRLQRPRAAPRRRPPTQ